MILEIRLNVYINFSSTKCHSKMSFKNVYILYFLYIYILYIYIYLINTNVVFLFIVCIYSIYDCYHVCTFYIKTKSMGTVDTKRETILRQHCCYAAQHLFSRTWVGYIHRNGTFIFLFSNEKTKKRK